MKNVPLFVYCIPYWTYSMAKIQNKMSALTDFLVFEHWGPLIGPNLGFEPYYSRVIGLKTWNLARFQ